MSSYPAVLVEYLPHCSVQWGNTTSEIDRNTTKTYAHNIAINEWLCGVAAYAWPTVGSYPLIAMAGDKNGYTLGAQNDLNNSGPFTLRYIEICK